MDLLSLARDYYQTETRMKLNTPKKYLKEVEYKAIYSKYKEFTMIQQREYNECLELASSVKNLQGCIVECGVWRGGMMAGIADILGKDRKYYLFDSFEGLPPAKEIDGESAIAWQKNVNSPWYFDNCKAEMDWADKAMKKAGTLNFKLVKGWFENTVPTYKLDEEITLLHLDADWYDSTIMCLEYFFPKVTKGGVIILDDYYVWDGCSKALHDYLSKNNCTERIMQVNASLICYLIKK
jgi:O-methyltransferase